MTRPAGDSGAPDVPQLVMVDGRDALAVIVIRPMPDKPGHVMAEANARGISKRDAAPMLRQIAQLWAEES